MYFLEIVKGGELRILLGNNGPPVRSTHWSEVYFHDEWR
jgi:hypothetical protein